MWLEKKDFGMKMKTQRFVPWFGSNTENASQVGDMLRGCRFVGIPFGGGMCEVPFIDAKQISVNDAHRHIVNLCRVVANDELRARLAKDADAQPYQPDVLAFAQGAARQCEPDLRNDPDYFAALWYFVAVWMGRGGNAGTASEFNGALPVRWNANGGGSNRRYRTAIEALDDWGETFRRCEFVCMDGMEFIARFPDTDGNGLYVDAPWPDAGDEYRHRFTESQQRDLADCLTRFQTARVVVRFGENPLIRELYREEAGWIWRPLTSRNQANDVKPEFLIVRNVTP